MVIGTLSLIVSASVAYFTSSGQATGNQIIVGTLRLAVDSTRTHTNSGAWNLFDAYNLWYDLNGAQVGTQTLETWNGAAPDAYSAYTAESGADDWPDGNYSYWIAYRNIGSIPMKVSGDVTGGAWVADPALLPGDPTCTDGNLNLAPTVIPRNVHFYQPGNCEGHEECANIHYGLTGLGTWTPYTTFENGVAGYAFDYNNSRTPIVAPVYGSTDGTNAGIPIQLDANEFVIARIDVNFDNSLNAGVDGNCYQGATFTYDLDGYAYQLGDGSW